MANHAPGSAIALERAVIKAEESPNTSITVYFNPKEITIDKPVPWQKHKNAESDTPNLEFTAAEPKTLAVELMFDLFEDRDGPTGGDIYKTYIEPLETLALMDTGLNRPPLCTFTWGRKMPVFKGVVEGLNVKYTLFLPDGTPCRATVNLKMKQAKEGGLMDKKAVDNANKAAAAAGGAPAAPGTNVAAGQTTGAGATAAAGGGPVTPTGAVPAPPPAPPPAPSPSTPPVR
jgi:hypothetical protein